MARFNSPAVAADAARRPPGAVSARTLLQRLSGLRDVAMKAHREVYDNLRRVLEHQRNVDPSAVSAESEQLLQLVPCLLESKQRFVEATVDPAIVLLMQGNLRAALELLRRPAAELAWLVDLGPLLRSAPPAVVDELDSFEAPVPGEANDVEAVRALRTGP